MVELIIQVDENDEIMSKRPKKDFIGTDIIFRTSDLLLFNPKGELLIQKRASMKKLYPNLYCFSVSGSVRDGETHEQTIEREMEEEIGIKTSYKKLFKFKSFNKLEKAFRMVFSTTHDGRPFKLQESEVESVKWISLDKIKEDINKNSEKYTPPFVKGMKIYFDKFHR